MRDMNFFQPYLQEPKKVSSKSFLVLFILLAAVALMAFYQVLLMNDLKSIEDEVDEINMYVNSNDTIKRLKNVEALQKEEQDKLQIYEQMMIADQKFQLEDMIDRQLVENVNSQVPDDLFLTNVEIRDSMMVLKGYATEYDAIAQLAFNLRYANGITNVMIPEINEEDGNFNFNMTAVVYEEAY